MDSNMMRKMGKGMYVEEDDDMTGGERGEGQSVFIDEKTITYEELKFNDDLDSDVEEK